MSSTGISTSAVDLDRSVFVRGNLNAMELMAFVKNWKDISVLQACRLVKKELFELTFHSQATADLFMDLGFSIRIGEKKAELRPANNRRKKVLISGLPGSFKEPLLRKYLQEIGSLESLAVESYDDDYSTVATGNWTAIIVSKSEPPPNIHMGEYTARLAFAGQRKICWDCNSPHPMTGKCPAPKCRNCQKPGHLIATCPAACSKCSGLHPLKIDCKMKTFLGQISTPNEHSSSSLPVSPSTTASTATSDASPTPVIDVTRPEFSHLQPVPAVRRKSAPHDLPSPSTLVGFNPTQASLPQDKYAHAHHSAYDRIIEIDFSLDHHFYPRQEFRALCAERDYLAEFIIRNYETTN